MAGEQPARPMGGEGASTAPAAVTFRPATAAGLARAHITPAERALQRLTPQRLIPRSTPRAHHAAAGKSTAAAARPMAARHTAVAKSTKRGCCRVWRQANKSGGANQLRRFLMQLNGSSYRTRLSWEAVHFPNRYIFALFSRLRL